MCWFVFCSLVLYTYFSGKKMLFTWQTSVACSYFCDVKTNITCFILHDLSADWANLTKCLQTYTDSLEQSTSPTLPASAAIPGNCTAAQASNQNGADHSSGDNSATRLQEELTVTSVISVGFYARTWHAGQAQKDLFPTQRHLTHEKFLQPFFIVKPLEQFLVTKCVCIARA